MWIREARSLTLDGMAPFDSIQPTAGAKADAALERSLDLFNAPTVQEKLDAHQFMEKCRSEFDTDARRNRAEHVTTELVELFGSAPAAGVLAAWRTAGGFPIGQWANFVLGFGAKAASIGLDVKLPKFDEMCDSPTTGRRVLRTIARSGKVLLHSQVSMLARDMIEDDK